MIPFRRFVIAQFFLGRQPEEINAKLRKFGYVATNNEIADIFSDIKSIAPESILEPLNAARPVTIAEGEGWFKHYGILEYMEYVEEKNHQDAFDNVLWIHNDAIVCTLVNALLYNDEDPKSVAAVIKFKYRKNMSQKAIEMHKSLFWDTSNISGIEAVRSYKHFGSNSLVVMPDLDETHDGIEEAIIFRDNEYIKWKIGYKEVKIPTSKDFLNQVKADSMHMYEEAKLMTRSVTRSHSEGNNVDEDGNPVNIDNTTWSYGNVTQAKLGTMKKAVDLFIKADKALPEEKTTTESDAFFEKIQQISISYVLDDKDKIVTGDEATSLLEEMVK